MIVPTRTVPRPLTIRCETQLCPGSGLRICFPEYTETARVARAGTAASRRKAKGSFMGVKLKVAGWLALGAVAGALATMQLEATARNSVARLPIEELQQLAAVFGMVKSDYVEPVDEKKLISDAIGGMVAGLDPHSQYFDKKTFKEFREATTGRFVGIGIEMGMEDGLVKVVSPIEGSPAFRAGLKSGDLITKIDDTLVKGLSVDQAVKRMRGEPNTKVVLTVFRKSEGRTFPVNIIREEIRTQSVRAKMVEPGYAWLRVSQFQDRTVEDFVDKLAGSLQAGPEPEGPRARPAQRPGRPARGRDRDLGGVPAGRRGRRHDQRPDSRLEGDLQGLARVLPAPRRRRSAAPPARRGEEGAADRARQRGLGVGQRDRRRRAAGLPARHRHGRADLRQGLGADRAPALARHGAEDHDGALLHAERRARSRPRASCPTSCSTRPPRATCSPRCARARPTSRSTCRAARAPS